VRLNERFVIDGRAVADEAMDDAIGEVRSAIEALRADGTLDVQPTFFEATTAAAFELFRRARSRWPWSSRSRRPTRRDERPKSEVTAITSIGFDHQLYLGSTLRKSRAEKAGIIKPSVPVVVGEMDPEAARAIEDVARAQARRSCV